MKITIGSMPLDDLEKSLQDAHAAVAPKQRRVWPWIMIAQALFIALCYHGMPYFKTQLLYDKAAMEAEEAAVSERARAYRKEEQAKRTRREIHEEHANPLKKQEREKRRRSLLSHVEELKLIAELMREKRDEELTRLIDSTDEIDWEQHDDQLDEALKKFSETAETIEKYESIDQRNEFDEAATSLLADTKALREKPQRNTEDREALTTRLSETETALDDLRDVNQETWSADLSEQTDDAQQVINLLNPLQRQLAQAQKNVQTSEKRLIQQRNRTLDEVKRELDRFKQSHRGLLSKKRNSEKVANLSKAINEMQKSTLKQKSEDKWDKNELDQAINAIKQSANGAKEQIRDIQNLGDQRETAGMAGLLGTQQRQADTQRNQWTQQKDKHADDLKKAQQAVTAAIENTKKQWAKTRDQLAGDQRGPHEKSLTKLFDEARKKSTEISQGKPTSITNLKNEINKSIEAIRKSATDNSNLQQEAGKLHHELNQVTHQLDQQANTAKRHTDEKRNLARRIRDEWRNAQRQLDDKARRAAPSLTKKPEDSSHNADLAKVAKEFQKIQNDTRQMEKSGELQKLDIEALLKSRSKALADLQKDTTKLNQTQRSRQNGIDRNEAQKLDQSLNRLAQTLGQKDNDVARQTAQHQKNIKQQESAVQKSLDRIKDATTKTESFDSPDAKAITQTLKAAPSKALELVTNPESNKALQEAVTKAKEQAQEWLATTNGEAPKRQQVMADTDQALRELSEAMALAGLTRQNVDFAQSLLDEVPAEEELSENLSLKEAVTAAEELHDRIEDDYQSIRAADLAARTGQSLENMKRLAESTSSRNRDIWVPKSDPEIKTIGDLNRYRKAMDEAVSKAEGLTQNARTLQRQALGDSHPDLASALQNARSQGGGTPSVGYGGPDPRRTKYRKGPNSVHQMTFDKRTGLNKKINFETVKAEALPGRRITADSLRKGWLYIDTWYIIGPWENYGKIDWGNRHPPEFGIDLGRTYPKGKNGRNLRWQFTQHPAIRCDVPDEQTNSSYYAYTELYFDEPHEMIVAMASNDAGKLWINNQVIWEDSGLSHWNLDESFQLIQFNKGFNKILMRVENGPAYCQFSLLLCPPDL